MKTLFTTAFLALPLALAAQDTKSAISDTDRLAAERSRREFFQLQSQVTQYQLQIERLAEQTNAKASETSAKLDALRLKCNATTETFDNEALTCVPKTPSPAKTSSLAPAKHNFLYRLFHG